MSSNSHHSRHTSHENHGSVSSYVIGFVLSLIFTFIPYYLVVNQVLTGNALLVAIVAIAVLQLAIQLLFFLHLGRGPKPLYNVVFFLGTFGIIVVIAGASLFIMNNLYRNMLPEEIVVRQAQREGISQVGGQDTGACKQNKDNHIVRIKDETVTPSFITAKRCDTLTFINEDDYVIELTFGKHEKHVSYGGEDVVVLDDDRPETITLNELGTYEFHDHTQPDWAGTFYVYE